MLIDMRETKRVKYFQCTTQIEEQHRFRRCISLEMIVLDVNYYVHTFGFKKTLLSNI